MKPKLKIAYNSNKLIRDLVHRYDAEIRDAPLVARIIDGRKYCYFRVEGWNENVTVA